MRSSGEIRFNYRLALSQASQLERLAERAERLSKQKMEPSMQSLSAAWKGESATAFLKKEEQLKRQILVSASEIRGIATDIRTIARRVYNAEMEALRIARSRRS